MTCGKVNNVIVFTDVKQRGNVQSVGKLLLPCRQSERLRRNKPVKPVKPPIATALLRCVVAQLRETKNLRPLNDTALRQREKKSSRNGATTQR